MSDFQAPDSRARPQLVILSKDPRGGAAKSRLAAEVGAFAARALAVAFLEDTIRLARGGDWETTLALEGDAPADAFPGMRFERQREGDLGQRIHAALASAGGRGRPCVLIGSDSPDLPVALIEQAFLAARRTDIVLGPAADGGFYLIGGAALPAELLADVPWSTSETARAVGTNARALGLRLEKLPPWADVDDRASLHALVSRLAGRSLAPATDAVLESLGLGVAGAAFAGSTR